MKKNFFSLLQLLTVIILVGCGEDSSSSKVKNNNAGTTEGQANDDNIVVGFAQLEVSNDIFQSKLSRDLQKLVEEDENVDGIFLDAMYDPVQQNIQIEDLINRKVDVIAVIPVNGESVVPAIKKAHEAGIKVISYNTGVAESGEQYVTTTVGQDSFLMGQAAGKVMDEALNGKGRVVEISGAPGFPISDLFSEGFRDTIIKNPNIEILDAQPGDWQRDKSRKVMENFITKYGDMIDGVYVGSEPQVFGALDAIKAAGLEDEIQVIAATVFPDGYKYIRNGGLSYYGGATSSPPDMAKLVFETAKKIAAGEDVPKEVMVDLITITPETVHDYEVPNWNE